MSLIIVHFLVCCQLSQLEKFLNWNSGYTARERETKLFPNERTKRKFFNWFILAANFSSRLNKVEGKLENLIIIFIMFLFNVKEKMRMKRERIASSLKTLDKRANTSSLLMKTRDNFWNFLSFLVLLCI